MRSQEASAEHRTAPRMTLAVGQIKLDEHQFVFRLVTAAADTGLSFSPHRSPISGRGLQLHTSTGYMSHSIAPRTHLVHRLSLSTGCNAHKRVTATNAR